MINLDNHPCFNKHARAKHGRIHLPVAPRCNVQCNFCSRKFDCVNESRPGVTSDVLSPGMALAYLNQVMEQRNDISVMGIAGPGDPFANPEETMETLQLVRAAYPDILLCIASNGLNLPSYVPALAQLNLSHVTVTVNAIDPKISSRIYSWVRYGKRMYHGEKAAQILLENQLAAIAEMKSYGMIVKVNTVVVNGVNDDHVVAIAEKMAELNVDILNCIPFYAVEGAAFANLPELAPAQIRQIRQDAGKHIPQMRHCTRCRADAVGLLGDSTVPNLKQIMHDIKTQPVPAAPPVPAADSSRRYLAVTSREGMLVNQHLGEAEQLFIYEQTDAGLNLVALRPTPPSGGGNERWSQLAETISDCHTLLVNGIGPSPKQVLSESGLQILEVDGLIIDIASALHAGQSIGHLAKREAFACGTSCSGNGGGCG